MVAQRRTIPLMATQPDSGAPQTEPAHSFAVIRSELTRLRSSLARIEGEVAALERRQRPRGEPGERPERYLRVLVDVYDRGGQLGVDADLFAAIGKEHGYDRRGLGGFFTGTRAPLRRGDDRITLTAQGEYLIDRYLSRLDS